MSTLTKAARSVSDAEILEKLTVQLNANAKSGSGFALVETAGGPNSPGPSNTLQADLYRPLRLPAIFVADWHLGGISTSVSAYESLRLRGYDVAGVAVLKDSYYQNYEYFRKYFEDQNIPFLAIPKPPEKSSADDQALMEQYYAQAERSEDGLSNTTEFSVALERGEEDRLLQLDNMANEGVKQIWWPFTQHKNLTAKDITTIDSAYGDYFQTLQPSAADDATGLSGDKSQSLLKATFDGSASWWTQGLGHANPALTMAAAYAAGRYGHVMFASAVNEPALNLATNLLRTVNSPRLSRVFYSDNGSTGMEVAVKMALGAACERYGWDSAKQEIEILGLQGSYHGDTIGVMDMSEPSVFNKKIHWYKGRGFWFECPSIKTREGVWIIEKPSELQAEKTQSTEFSSLQEIFDQNRDSTDDAAVYEKFIKKTLHHLTKVEKRRFGALVMEPVVLGAGGMFLV